MKVILKSENLYVLRFDAGDEIISSLAAFCEQENIQAGYFSIIGAAKEVRLSYYHLETKTYQDKTYTEDLEITGIHGNVGRMDGKVMIHAHGTFGNAAYEAIAGHVKKLVVSATGEAFLQVLSGVLERGYDERTGLNLLK